MDAPTGGQRRRQLHRRQRPAVGGAVHPPAGDTGAAGQDRRPCAGLHRRPAAHRPVQEPGRRHVRPADRGRRGGAHRRRRPGPGRGRRQAGWNRPPPRRNRTGPAAGRRGPMPWPPRPKSRRQAAAEAAALRASLEARAGQVTAELARLTEGGGQLCRPADPAVRSRGPKNGWTSWPARRTPSSAASRVADWEQRLADAGAHQDSLQESIRALQAKDAEIARAIQDVKDETERSRAAVREKEGRHPRGRRSPDGAAGRRDKSPGRRPHRRRKPGGGQPGNGPPVGAQERRRGRIRPAGRQALGRIPADPHRCGQVLRGIRQHGRAAGPGGRSAQQNAGFGQRQQWGPWRNTRRCAAATRP